MINKTAFALLALASASMAQAVTFTSSAGAPDPGPATGETLLVDFNSTTLPEGYSLTGGYGYETATSANHYAAPAGDTTQYLYMSSELTPNTATLTTAFDLHSLSFYWGSIDKYNSVEVLGTINGGPMTTLLTMNGGELPPANGDQGAGLTNRRVYYTAGAGELIDGLKFISTGVAFEIDDIAGSAGDSSGSTVPEPASWSLMIVGFGMVGVSRRRRKQSAMSVAA